MRKCSTAKPIGKIAFGLFAPAMQRHAPQLVLQAINHKPYSLLILLFGDSNIVDRPASGGGDGSRNMYAIPIRVILRSMEVHLVVICISDCSCQMWFVVTGAFMEASTGHRVGLEHWENVVKKD